MSRYKGRASLKVIKSKFPHHVDMVVPEGGFAARLNAMHDWHDAHGISYIRPHTRCSMTVQFISPYLRPILPLIGSNGFMTLAWYGHLRFKETPLFLVIFVAWLIAFIEYCLAVPANRYGSAIYSPAQLKTMQEVITLFVFAGFSVLYLNQPITWNYAIGFALIGAGAFFVFRGPL
jgi:uncharacterized protein (DUF486 family)